MYASSPAAGTSAVIWQDPSRPDWPSDGIRYKQTSEGGERFSTTQLPLPNNPSNIVEVETGILSHGIFPPSSPAIPLTRDSPDLLLARFRLRWRIVTPGIGNLALWLVYWGRDERQSERAPQGWEREVIRKYPLPTINEPQQFPLKTGGRVTVPGQHALQQPPMMKQSLPLAPPQMQQSTNGKRPTSANPMPLNANQTNGRPMSGTQQNAISGNAATSASSTPKMRKAQPLSKLQQQQQQQQQQAAAAAEAARLQAQHERQNQQDRLAVMRFPQHMLSFPQAWNDPYEYLSDRSWAGLRYEHNHALLLPLFDAVSQTLAHVFCEYQELELTGVQCRVYVLKC